MKGLWCTNWQKLQWILILMYLDKNWIEKFRKFWLILNWFKLAELDLTDDLEELKDIFCEIKQKIQNSYFNKLVGEQKLLKILWNLTVNLALVSLKSRAMQL